MVNFATLLIILNISNMWGAIIGAGLSLASSIAGGIANSNARKKQERMLARQQQENKAWFDRKYNEDPTKRADTVRLLTQMQEQIKNRNKAARGRQAVMGGTEDSTTAVKEANNKTLADTTAQIVAANESRKDSIEQQYQNNKNRIEGQQMQMEADKAGNTASTVAGVAGTAANIASALDSGESKNGSKTNNTSTSKYLSDPLHSKDVSGLKAETTRLPSQDELKNIHV